MSDEPLMLTEAEAREREWRIQLWITSNPEASAEDLADFCAQLDQETVKRREQVARSAGADVRSESEAFAQRDPARRGRPPKYATEEERLEARREQKRRWARERSPEQRKKAREATRRWREKQ